MGLWILLLLVGVWNGSFARGVDRRLFLAIAAVVGGQLLLHAFFGLDVFVYGPHYGPVLILLASFASRADGWIGRSVTFMAVALVAVEVTNNIEQFLYCADIVRNTLPSPR